MEVVDVGQYWVDDLLEVLSAAGIPFGLNEINLGWERRSRSSGGFDAAPLGIVAHHTASKASVESDLSYMINGSPDRPVGNMLLDRNGIVWPIAAGGANTQGKGGPCTFSRGVAPLDKGNTTLWAIEAANNGVGEEWPQIQIDTYFECIIALNAAFGNFPSDVITHSIAEGMGWTSRKVDPATAAAVQGPWRPGSVNSSGTWSMMDLVVECSIRAVGAPPLPGPTPDQEIDMLYIAVPKYPGSNNNSEWWAVFASGAVRRAVNSDVTYAGFANIPQVNQDSKEHDDFLRSIAIQ
jgi:N-acetylmuramoyl-L-alanine amidase